MLALWIPKGWHVTYRIGINISDIIVEGDDIYGDGVSVAARSTAMSLKTRADIASFRI